MARSLETAEKRTGASRDGRRDQLITDAASAFVLLSASALLLYMAGSADLIPFALPGAAVFFIWCRVGPLTGRETRLKVTAAVLAVLLIAGLPMRGVLADGSALLINKLFDIAQRSHTYVYYKLYVSESANETDMRLAVTWSTLAAGFIAACAPPFLRKAISVFITVMVMLAFAFFGLTPSVIASAALFLSLLVTMTGTGVTKAWPLMAVLVIASSLLFIADPGEIRAVSRADEILRDRLSFQTVYLEGDDLSVVEEKSYSQKDEQSGGAGSGGNEDGEEALKNKRLMIVLALTAVTLMILFIPAFIHDRLEKKRRKNRGGIDSGDNAVAIRSMFPYALRWLKVYGIDVVMKDFGDVARDVRYNTPESFSSRYESMLALWKEAAFSEHEMSDESRQSMQEFLDEAVRLTKEQADWRKKLSIRFRYAL